MQDFKVIEKYLLENSRRNKRVVLFSISIVFIILIILNWFFWLAPKTYPIGTLYNLESGQTLSLVSQNFHNEDIIKSDFWFKSFSYLFSFGTGKIAAGYYQLNKREPSYILAWRITHGIYETIPIKVTIPEGLNSTEIANILTRNLKSFDSQVFLDLVKSQKLEGYLFPDTYFLINGMKESEIIKMMNNNFYFRIKSILPQITAFSKSESDVIKMASILEEEARTTTTKQIVAGILWKRIALGMPLQVDSSFKYLLGKTSVQLTDKDLKLDSLYNSYTHLGLPPTPISNPGIDSIKAAITPIETKYLYFLSDKEGNMHYATTLQEHLANRVKYLK